MQGLSLSEGDLYPAARAWDLKHLVCGLSFPDVALPMRNAIKGTIGGFFLGISLFRHFTVVGAVGSIVFLFHHAEETLPLPHYHMAILVVPNSQQELATQFPNLIPQ